MKIRDIIRPLLQEIYQDDGWKMLTCCMLLNLTNRKQVDTIRDELFKKYPTPHDMMKAKHSDLANILKPLGLYNRRAKSLRKMSRVTLVVSNRLMIYMVSDNTQKTLGRYFRIII